tara:strand:+ start:87 stop:689 length:603 start_codon:yes stop_codon:yes gene_type:complete
MYNIFFVLITTYYSIKFIYDYNIFFRKRDAAIIIQRWFRNLEKECIICNNMYCRRDNIPYKICKNKNCKSHTDICKNCMDKWSDEKFNCMYCRNKTTLNKDAKFSNYHFQRLMYFEEQCENLIKLTELLTQEHLNAIEFDNRNRDVENKLNEYNNELKKKFNRLIERERKVHDDERRLRRLERRVAHLVIDKTREKFFNR